MEIIAQLLKLAGIVGAAIVILWLASACGCKPVASTVDAPHAPTLNVAGPDGGLGGFDPALSDRQSIGGVTHYHFRDALDGQYRSDEVLIHWRGLTNSGVEPLEIVNATIARLQFEQSTELQSNANSKALAALMQARTALEGRDTHMPDGTPIYD